MILFVFEGKEREVNIFNALKELYFSAEEVIVEFTYNTGFHTLYKNLKKNDMSLFRVLQEASKKRKDDKLGAYNEDDFSEVFLVFDYDFHNKSIPIEQWNKNLGEMLDYFDDETRNGKMYVNYPMVESIRYTKLLLDKDYYKYTVKRDECMKVKGKPESGFKYLAAAFSAYIGLDFIQILKINARNTSMPKRVAFRFSTLFQSFCTIISNSNFFAQIKTPNLIFSKLGFVSVAPLGLEPRFKV